MTKKRIFVSGVAGFLGSHLAERFLEQGHSVVGCDNLIGGYLDNVPKGIEFHQYDCNSHSHMREITKDVDIVYHCAALAYEGFSVFSPSLITNNIVSASVNLMSNAVANGVKRFVFCSSMARYGENQVPFIEDMPPNPKDPYGIGKYASELLLRNIAETHGMEYVIAVPHNIIGPRQKYDDPYRNVASIMANLMIQGRQPIIYGDGNQKRCFSFVQDDVWVLEKMAFDKSLAGHVINVGPDEEFVTINELANALAEILSFKELRPMYVPDRPQEVRYAHCSAAKAREMLGYNTRYSLKQGLGSIVDYIKARGAKPFQYHLDLEIINHKTPKTWTDRLF